MLALTPAWVGHGLFNCKDIPFGAAAAFAVAYSTARIAMGPSPLTWRDAWCAGLSVGCALGFRPGGMFLIGYPALAAFARLVIDSARAGDKAHHYTLREWHTRLWTVALCAARDLGHDARRMAMGTGVPVQKAAAGCCDCQALFLGRDHAIQRR